MSVNFLAREQMSWTLLDANGGYEQMSAACLPGLVDAGLPGLAGPCRALLAGLAGPCRRWLAGLCRALPGLVGRLLAGPCRALLACRAAWLPKRAL